MCIYFYVLIQYITLSDNDDLNLHDLPSKFSKLYFIFPVNVFKVWTNLISLLEINFTTSNLISSLEIDFTMSNFLSFLDIYFSTSKTIIE